MRTNSQCRQAQAGLTLIELVVFIVVVGVAVAGVLGVMQFTTRHSADPLPRKQALAIAESLMEEIQLQSFTVCDPDDPVWLTATPPTSAANCTAGYNEEAPLGPESGESRYAAATPFDHVSDYAGFTMTGIRAIDNTPVPGLESYNAAVTVSTIGAAEASTLGLASVNDALIITVRVTGPAGADISLTGYRFRFD